MQRFGVVRRAVQLVVFVSTLFTVTASSQVTITGTGAGAFKCTENADPAIGAAGTDYLWCDSSHWLTMNNNNAPSTSPAGLVATTIAGVVDTKNDNTIYSSQIDGSGNPMYLTVSSGTVSISASTSVPNTNFLNNVMTQGSIDGVTVIVSWANVEKTDPTNTGGTCGSGVNDDTHQLDPSGFCHTYDWSTTDGMPCTSSPPFSGTLLGQFFCTINWTKKVNALIFGITTNPNSSTPRYLWSNSTWVSNVGTQDVVNSLRDDDAGCVGYNGYGGTTQIASAQMQPSGAVIVTMQNLPAVPFHATDQIWVKGFDTGPPDFNMHTAAGTTVGTVGPGLQFTYTSSCPGACGSGSSSHIGNIVSAQSSFPLPTEASYKTGFRAFVAAAVYHFSHSNTGTGGVINAGQVAYMRVGHAYGAEAYPQCQAQWPQDTTKDAWLSFYADTNNYLMGITNATEQQLGPIFHMQTSINTGGTPLSPDPTYADIEAALSVQYTGGDLRPFGFGTQGLQNSDFPCTTSTADWCQWFSQFWLGGPGYKNTEFELQQIDCSNPTGTNDGGMSSCFLGTSGTGKTGDLRVLLPWIASTEHATILELYAQDALLAFDPNFCDPDTTGMTCKTSGSGDSFTGLALSTQYKFYQAVGQGHGCNISAPSTATGDCSYATAAVDPTHGTH